MTEPFLFTIPLHKNSKSFSFSPGLHIIYGESGVGKSELVKYLSVNTQFQTIQQNPDLQIISNTIENELAFGLECNSQDNDFIQRKLFTAKSNFIFNVDFRRHPATLSGGEKELLNIAAITVLPAQILLIDDALSFLNNSNKHKVVEQLNKQITNNKSIVLWFTSDINDLQYCKTIWELTQESLLELSESVKYDYPNTDLKAGKSSLLIQDLVFHYDKNYPIFDRLTIEVNNFRCLGIVGDNGSGKSTLASLILNLEKPVSGNISLKLDDKPNISIGYLDQFPEKLLGANTLNEFIDNLINNNKLEAHNIEIIERELKSNNIIWNDINEKLGLDLPWTILRLVIIIILCNCKYDMLILDEPTFGIGWRQKLTLHAYFEHYLNDKHLIIISHDRDFVSSACDKTIIINKI